MRQSANLKARKTAAKSRPLSLWDIPLSSAAALIQEKKAVLAMRASQIRIRIVPVIRADMP